MRAPGGASTDSNHSFTPAASRRPAMRTTGKGRISRSVGALTSTVSVATADEPSAAVTRRRTTWVPAVAKGGLTIGPPPWKAPLPVRSRAKPVIGLVKSVDVEANDTVSPACGAVGDHRNETLGCACAPDVATSAANATAVALRARDRAL